MEPLLTTNGRTEDIDHLSVQKRKRGARKQQKNGRKLVKLGELSKKKKKKIKICEKQFHHCWSCNQSATCSLEVWALND